ncbi:MAG: DUF4129 domain-containing protein [Gemmatimonadota bacterium]|jgi:hypothetical protein
MGTQLTPGRVFDGSRRWWAGLPPTLSLPALAVALVGLLAVASGGGSVLAPSGGGGADRFAIVVVVTVVFGLGLPLAAAVTLAIRRVRLARRGSALPSSVALRRAVPITAFTLTVASMLLISRGGLPLARRAAPAPFDLPGNPPGTPLEIDWWDTPVRAGEGEPEREGPSAGETSDRATLLLLLAVLGTVGAIAIGFGLRYSRRSRPLPLTIDLAQDEARATAHGAVVGTIDAMLADPDPKTAIIGAYARLLEGLAASGTPRRPYEGPMEHLHRVLATLRVRPAPLRRLIELFQVARFSSHRLTSRHRDRALEALQAVAADLTGPTGPRPPARSTAGAES